MRSVLRLSIWLVLLLAACGPSSLLALVRADDDEYPKLSPFEAIRWSDSTPEVRVGGIWYRLRAVAGESAEDLVAFSKKTFGSRWQKRIEEDLVEVLDRKGKRPDRFVSLDLEELSTGKRLTLERVEMTEENRRAIWSAAVARSQRPASESRPRVHRVAREHSPALPSELRQRIAVLPIATGATLARAKAWEDLDQLEWTIEHEFAYRDRKGVDYRGLLDAVRAQLPEDVRVGTLALAIVKVLAQFGDGHARVAQQDALWPEGYLPFLVEETASGLVAVRPDRSSFVDPEKPFVTQLDGVDIETWIQASSRIVAQGSPALVRRRSIRGLRFIRLLRAERGQPDSDVVTVGLRDERGRAATARLPLQAAVARYGDRFPAGHRVLDGDVGYLRIAEMDSANTIVDELLAALGRFADTKGLVIDVRGNGEGSREILTRLFPLLPCASGEPTVVNAARYRLREGDRVGSPEGYLSDRFLYPATFSRWSDKERDAIQSFTRSFRPEWIPATDGFSDWHYLVLGGGEPSGAKRYARPVVVLQDSDCFSATDVFLSAVHGLPGITTMGTASSGGSGRALPVTLVHSGLVVSLSSMVSYQRDGRLLDGNGVAPDVRLEAEPTDFIGRSDSMLRAAVDRLLGKR